MSAGPLRELLLMFGVEVDTSHLKQADGLVDKVKKGIIGLAAVLTTSAIANELRQIANVADEVADTSAKLNFSTQALQEWRYVAKLSGIEAEALGGAIRKASLHIAEATKDAAKGKAFKDLGVEIRDANDAARTTEDIFGDVITRLAAITDPGKRAAASAEIFGKSFTELNPLLAQGADGIAKLRQELRQNGGLISSADIEAAGKFNDELDRLEFVANGAKAKLLGVLAPALTSLAQGLVRGVTKTVAMAQAFKEWVKTSQPLRNSLRFVATLLTVVAAKMAPRALLLGVTSLASKWGLVRGFIGRALLVLGRFILRMAIPALLLDDLIVTFQGGDSIIRRILDRWFGAGSTAQVVAWFGGFFTGIDGLTEGFSGLFDFFLALLATAAFEAKALFLGIGGAILDGVAGGWNSLVSSAEAGLNRLIALANKIPGVDIGAADLSGTKGGTDNAATITKALGAERLGVAERLAASTDRAFGTRIGGGAIVGAPQINVTVPPGTPANLASRVGAASSRGSQQGMKAALAASKQRGA